MHTAKEKKKLGLILIIYLLTKLHREFQDFHLAWRSI